MTQTTPNTMACPECAADDSIELALGERLCLACRHEWNPLVDAAVRAVEPYVEHVQRSDDPDIARVLSATTPDEVLTEPLTAAERIAEHTGVEPADDADPLLGRFVRIVGYTDLALVVETGVDGGRAVIEWASGIRSTFPTTDLSALTDEEVNEHNATPAVDVDDDGPIVGVIATIASLVLSVGAEAVAGDEDRTLLNPRIGWLPPPASDIPEVEQGAAYAVAILIRTFNLDGNVVIEIAQSLMAGAAAEAAETSEQ